MKIFSSWGRLDDNTNYSYGTNGAFIDLLMRHYDGIELLRKISHNDYFNREAISSNDEIIWVV